MINPDFSYRATWLYDQRGVGPLFKAVEKILDDSSLEECTMCDAIFHAGDQYRRIHSDKHSSVLESLFDALAICEFVLTLESSQKSKRHHRLMLICMELYLKASMFKLDEWMNPGKITDAELLQLEVELSFILGRIEQIEA